MLPTNAPAHAYRRRFLIATLALTLCSAGVWAYSQPAFVPQAADMARAIFGPEAVAEVEAWAFQTQDTLRQMRYQATGTSGGGVHWAAPATNLPPTARSSPGRRATRAPLVAQANRQPAADVSATTSWSPLVYVAGQPVLERAIVSPDPDRPYVQAALVRIDMRYARLHLVAGTEEPASSARARRPGSIPRADQRVGYLLAAFNGGFKAANGAFGMAVDGLTLLPPSDGLATLALYRDGSVRLGIWRQDIGPTPDIVTYRQNCPLLVDGGALTPQARTDDAALWGHTVKNKIATWRSGLGLSADGRYLIYAAGDGLTVPTLGQALIDGGVERAMQLDINSYWTRFVTYAPAATGKGLAAQKLTDAMVGDARQFLAPDTRDFFYVTAH
jgi:Phosphodiester glycosidase